MLELLFSLSVSQRMSNHIRDVSKFPCCDLQVFSICVLVLLTRSRYACTFWLARRYAKPGNAPSKRARPPFDGRNKLAFFFSFPPARAIEICLANYAASLATRGHILIFPARILVTTRPAAYRESFATKLCFSFLLPTFDSSFTCKYRGCRFFRPGDAIFLPNSNGKFPAPLCAG